MQYLRLKRSRIILGSFLAFSLLAILFPQVDLQISRLFFDGTFFLHDQWWQKLLRNGLRYFLIGSMAVVVAVYVRNRFLKRRECVVDACPRAPAEVRLLRRMPHSARHPVHRVPRADRHRVE